MKTNALFTLLLVAVVAFAAGCQTSWQSKIAGNYKSVIFNGDDEYDAKTSFKAGGDKLSGEYELDVYGTVITGKLSKFNVIGDRQLKCRWRDDEDRVGDFSMTFSQDLSSFKGHWEPDDGDGNGAWNGKKVSP